MLSNGEMLVGLNEHGLVHDFYYPYVGLENLTTARSVHHMVGVWVDGHFSWVDDGSWQIEVDFEQDALVSKIVAERADLGVRLRFEDCIDSQYTALLRHITVENLVDRQREIRLFMHQVFQISNDGRADTVLYVPKGNYLFDYKGRCALLISARDQHDQPFDQFSVGNYGIEGKEGTYRDAEDGELSGNLVEHGSVDSVLRCCLTIDARSEGTVNYWIIASYSQYDAEAIHNKLIEQGIERRITATRTWWHQWLATAKPSIDSVFEKYQPIFKKSLLVIKAHIDKRGGTIASCDSSIYNYGRDYYSYVWPRDGGLTMLTLIELGYTAEPKRFFDFCADTIHPGGYMMHKYQPDRAIGSTWHPLMHQHHPELAIQEDETAVVIYAFAAYMDKHNDIDFLRKHYDHLIKPAANFMSGFIDEQTSLPHASYDLWEERFATHTYTAAITRAALKKAARLAEQMEDYQSAEQWKAAGQHIQDGLKLLFNPHLQAYRKSVLLLADGNLEFNDTVDISSVYGVAMFDESRLDSEAVKQAVKVTESRLLDSSPAGGVIRYEHDGYFLAHHQYLGNPWLICTLWLAQYYAKTAQLDKAWRLVDWAVERCGPSGMLAEQVDPVDGHHVGVSPLVWSHAELVNTLLMLAKKD